MLNFKKKKTTMGLFSGEIMRDLPIFIPKISLKFAKWEKKISYKNENSAKDFAKISS